MSISRDTGCGGGTPAPSSHYFPRRAPLRVRRTVLVMDFIRTVESLLTSYQSD